jgi:hypothetical protein
MKTRITNKAKKLASTIVIALVIASVLCLSVAAYLHLIEQQNFLSARSQAWNMAIAVVEAGIEEALAQLNSNSANLSADGWSFDGAFYTRTRTLPGGNSYTVSIDALTDPLNPSIVSRAYISSPIFSQNAQPPVFFATVGSVQTPSTGPLTRAVQAYATRGRLFSKAMVAKLTIDLKGNNIVTDSFDSGNPAYSTNGQYDKTKARDNGDVASNDTIVNSINVGNANIYGHVSTGPKGTIYIGPNGGIGSHSWQQSNKGIEPNPPAPATPWLSDNSNFTFPTIVMPSTTGYLTPTSGTVVTTSISGGVVTLATNHYDHVLYSGNYTADSLSGSTIVLGQATLVLPNGWSMGGSDTFTIANTGVATVYVGGNSLSLSGKGLINQPGLAGDLVIYCANSVTSVSFNGNAGFNGVFVAPSANVTLNGSGSTPVDFVGSLIVNSVVMNGHFNFHYDEALGRLAANGRYLVTSWNEIH